MLPADAWPEKVKERMNELLEDSVYKQIQDWSVREWNENVYEIRILYKNKEPYSETVNV